MVHLNIIFRFIRSWHITLIPSRIQMVHLWMYQQPTSFIPAFHALMNHHLQQIDFLTSVRILCQNNCLVLFRVHFTRVSFVQCGYFERVASADEPFLRWIATL